MRGTRSSCASRSKPVPPGIWMSRNTTSGDELLDARARLVDVARLADDLDARRTRASNRRSSRRARGSSSTTSAFMRGSLTSAVAMPGLRKIEAQAGARTEQQSQALGRIPQARRLRCGASCASGGRGFVTCEHEFLRRRPAPAMRSVPPSLSCAMPCLMAFSTRVCSSMAGTRAVRAAGSMSRSTRRRSASRMRLERQIVVHHLELALQRNEILVARATACSATCARAGSRHPARAPGSSAISDRRPFSALNRKCGLSCDFSRRSSAACSASPSCAWRNSAWWRRRCMAKAR